MGVSLTAIIYVWFAHGLAFFLIPWSVPLSLRVRTVALWIISAPIFFLLPSPFVALLLIAILMMVAAPAPALDRSAFFLIAVTVVPTYYVSPLPFPGINYLIEISHYKLAGALLLLPMLFVAHKREGRTRIFTTPNICFALFIVYTAVLFGMAESTTVGFRVLADNILLLALPYFVLHLMVRRIDDVSVFLQAFLIASVPLATVALVSFAVKWDIYALLNPFQFMDIRGGWARINATANTHSMAFHFAAAIVVLEFVKHRMGIGWIWCNGLRVLFLAGMMTTASRGALAGLVVAFGLYALFMLKSTFLRVVTIFSAVVGVILVGFWLTQTDLSAFDPHGTFAYRQELLWTSLKYIQEHLFFGDLNFIESEDFEHLVQGQGIIDITNFYLQLALSYGLIGFTLFLFAIIRPTLSLVPALLTNGKPAAPFRSPAGRTAPAPDRESVTERQEWRRASAVTVAIIGGWLVLVATTSGVALTLHLGIVFAALAKGLRDVRPQAVRVTPLATRTPAPLAGAPVPVAPC